LTPEDLLMPRVPDSNRARKVLAAWVVKAARVVLHPEAMVVHLVLFQEALSPVVDSALNMACRQICLLRLLSQTAQDALLDQPTPGISLLTFLSWADADTMQTVALEVMVRAVEVPAHMA
jgi:hypothetical protein